MKRLIAVLLLMALLAAEAAVPALADEKTPNPIPVLSKEEIPATPAGIHHYMLICMDRWNAELNTSWTKNMKAWKTKWTDGLILLTMDELAHRVVLTSFIRDMLIMRPDGIYGRINNFLYVDPTRDAAGWAWANQKTDIDGLNALVDTINSHFGLRIEKFIVVDFKQVENIIDAVGGVDIDITDREAHYLKNYTLPASSTTPPLVDGRGGVYHFTGHAAVIYMRIRKIKTREYLHSDGTMRSDTQDYGRTYRTRTVLTTIAESLKDISYEDAEKLFKVVVDNTVYTNMTTDDLTEAFELALALKSVPVEHIRMPADGTKYEEFPHSGMATKQIDFEENRAVLHDFLFNQDYVVVDDEDE